MLQRQHVICGVIDHRLVVPGNGWVRSWRVPKADVSLRAAVKESFLADLVVNPHEPGIFVDGRLSPHSE